MTQEQTLTRLLTNKAKLSESRIDRLPLPEAQEGEAIFKINRVALTTNNITYALLGESMQYWDFFPSGVDGWGQMPAWGFADVVSSKVAGVEPGERFYGYFPIATHLRVQPVRVSARGFHDGSPHRASLTSAYNQYARTSTDAVYLPELENYQILLRPLIITSFFGADFLEDNKFFGAKQLLISSASSKTAYGTAFCLRNADIELVGLTSAGNKAFVESLGCYHRVVTYDELATLDPSVRTTYLDFAGADSLRGKVHHHFGDALAYDCLAGSAQNTDPHHLKTEVPGPKPELYFAPVQIKKRNKEWGYDGVNQRFGDAQRAFIERVADPEKPWMKVVEHAGFEGAAKLTTDLANGKIDPVAGHIVTL